MWVGGASLLPCISAVPVLVLAEAVATSSYVGTIVLRMVSSGQAGGPGASEMHSRHMRVVTCVRCSFIGQRENKSSGSASSSSVHHAGNMVAHVRCASFFTLVAVGCVSCQICFWLVVGALECHES